MLLRQQRRRSNAEESISKQRRRVEPERSRLLQQDHWF